MNIWLLQASEPMPVVNKGQRLLRIGMIAEELTNRGHNVVWFSNTFDHFKKKQLFNENTIVQIKENYMIYLMHGPKYKKNISISRILNHKIIAVKFRKISKKLEKPDLIYAAFPTIDYAEEAVKYGKKNNIPTIVDVRDLWPDIFNHNLNGIIKLLAQPYIKLMDYKTKKIMKDAYAINSNSEAMLDWGLEKGKREKKENDRHFYFGYNKANYIEETNIIDKTKFNISFFATINNQFNYDFIVELAKKLQAYDKNIVINIGGDGPQYEELKQKAKDCDNIKLLGWIGKNEINYILKNSKLGLAPYKNTFDFQKNVTNKFAEYLSYGLPILITVDGCMKKMLFENKCGIGSQNVEELFEFIKEIKNNDEKYNEMSKNAVKLYEENFIAEKVYKSLGDYLENIIKSK